YIQQALALSSDPAGTYASLVEDRHVLLENPMRESSPKKESSVNQARQQGEGNWKKLKELGRNSDEAKGF
ncbi:hypothetical protein PAXINDRAFT_88260, partial [Paxillus involutus ATCC 200175]